MFQKGWFLRQTYSCLRPTTYPTNRRTYRWVSSICLRCCPSPGCPSAISPILVTGKTPNNTHPSAFFEEQGVQLQRILTDRGTEYCGKPEHHAYQLYLAIEDINHSKTKANHPQTNGICERFHKTMQDECYSLLFRKKLYQSLEELQVDVDEWVRKYNEERPHSGRYCYGKTPWQTFLDNKHLALEKDLNRGGDRSDTTTRPIIPVG
jgi:Integrase core domain